MSVIERAAFAVRGAGGKWLLYQGPRESANASRSPVPSDAGARLIPPSNHGSVDVEHAVIVDVEATTAVRQAEAGAAQVMLTRTAERLACGPSD